jgi:hypothetical protein
MNPKTAHLIRRGFAEVVDDVLTSLVGGIVNEPIIYDVKSDTYPLARPALSVRGITGIRSPKGNGGNGVNGSGNHQFQQNVDFRYDPDLAAIVWLEKGEKPADGSRFFVDYFLPDANAPVTDINVGSVVRTLSEAISREIATLYEEVNRAYAFGFVDTAEDKALDFVVAILGVERKTNDFAAGLATFFRDPVVAGAITIPSGTVVSANEGAVEFETTEQRTLQRGQIRIDAPIRAGSDYPGPEGRVDAAAITEIVRPIAGIDRVTNFEPTLGASSESDTELRTRAKAALYALGKATLPAIEAAVRSNFAKTIEIWDPNGPPARRSALGTVALLIEAEPERSEALRNAVEEARAAGVLATLVARYVFVTPKIVAKIAAGLTSEGKQKLVDEIIRAVDEFVQPLSSGDPLNGADLLKALKAVEDVKDVRIVEVLTARSVLTPTGPETLVDLLVEFILGEPPTEETALRRGLDDLLFKAAPGGPTGARIPDRSLLKNAAGDGPATDADVEAGTFQVIAEIGGEPGWIVAEMDAADIALVEDGV